MDRISRLCASALLLVLLLSLSWTSARATNIKMHTMTTLYADGAYPVGQFALNGTAYYGFTEYGIGGAGSFVKMASSGGITNLSDFASISGGPNSPNAGPVMANGKFYATSTNGGATGHGCVFEVTTAGVVTVKYSFGPLPDAEYPKAGLIYNSADGFLYGTTLDGGTNNQGTVFKIKPDGTGYSIIHNFDASLDCSNPYGGVCLGPDGMLWGTSYYAKGFSGGIYKLNTDSTGYTFVSGFASNDIRGNRPLCDLVLGKNGKLYGTNLYGGAYGNGTLFSVDTSSNTVSLVWAFDGYTGAEPGFNAWQDPQYRLTPDLKNGYIYGVTRYGGYYGYGAVFKYDPATGNVTLVGSLTLNTANGTCNPLTLNGSNLVGTSFNGGVTASAGPNGTYPGWGSGFSCSVSGTVKLLHSFYIRDGYYAEDGPTASIGGSLFGVTRDGGQYGWGTIYKISTTGPGYGFTILHSFNNYYEEGVNPYGGLIKHTDNNLYGCTYSGGRFGNGTIFKITTAGVFTIVHHFRGSLEGWDCYRRLASGYGTDKKLYGVCYQGGPNNQGTIFATDTAGKAFQIIHYFGGPDGINPGTQLCVEGDSGTNTTKWLYGGTYQGGANNIGVIYRVSPNGATFTKLHDCASATGAYFYYNGSMYLDTAAGKLYGTTWAGGGANIGSIWSLDTTSFAYSILHSFNNNSPSYEGYNPVGGLVTDGSGNFYGNCRTGGTAGAGTVWKYTPSSNTFTKLHDFLGNPGNEGSLPYGSLVYDSTLGLLFGCTEQGGGSGTGMNVGTIWSQTLTP